jgi:hypothetical protein
VDCGSIPSTSGGHLLHFDFFLFVILLEKSSFFFFLFPVWDLSKKYRIYTEVDGDKLKELNDKNRKSWSNLIKAQNSGCDSVIFYICLPSLCFEKLFSILHSTLFSLGKLQMVTNLLICLMYPTNLALWL